MDRNGTNFFFRKFLIQKRDFYINALFPYKILGLPNVGREMAFSFIYYWETICLCRTIKEKNPPPKGGRVFAAVR
jgi:hypothetical protein